MCVAVWRPAGTEVECDSVLLMIFLLYRSKDVSSAVCRQGVYVTVNPSTEQTCFWCTISHPGPPCSTWRNAGFSLHTSLTTVGCRAHVFGPKEGRWAWNQWEVHPEAWRHPHVCCHTSSTASTLSNLYHLNYHGANNTKTINTVHHVLVLLSSCWELFSIRLTVHQVWSNIIVHF